MPSKQKQVEMFLLPALVSAVAAIMVFSIQQALAIGCDDSCDSLVKIDDIKVGKIESNKVLNAKDPDKVLDSDKVLSHNKINPENVLSGNFGGDKIKINGLNVLTDSDNSKPKIKVLPDNNTYIKIKDFKVLIPKK